MPLPIARRVRLPLKAAAAAAAADQSAAATAVRLPWRARAEAAAPAATRLAKLDSQLAQSLERTAAIRAEVVKTIVADARSTSATRALGLPTQHWEGTFAGLQQRRVELSAALASAHDPALFKQLQQTTLAFADMSKRLGTELEQSVGVLRKLQDNLSGAPRAGVTDAFDTAQAIRAELLAKGRLYSKSRDDLTAFVRSELTHDLTEPAYRQRAAILAPLEAQLAARTADAADFNRGGSGNGLGALLQSMNVQLAPNLNLEQARLARLLGPAAKLPQL